MLDDQQRITEAYKLVQEAAPVGIGSRLGTWAAGKAVGALGPLARGAQSRNLGQKDFQQEVNKLKIELNRYLGKVGVGKSEITSDILASYLISKGHKTPTVNTLQTPANVDSILSDNDVNKYIIQSYKEKALNKPNVGNKPQQQVPQPAQQTTSTQTKQAVDQKRVATSIARSLKNKPLTSKNLLNALAARGLELTNR
jgi:hypothetical protein